MFFGLITYNLLREKKMIFIVIKFTKEQEVLAELYIRF